MVTATFEIPKFNIDGLEQQLDRLRKRAVKLGIMPPVLTITREEVRDVPNRRGKGTTPITFCFVTLTHDPIILAGWKLVAAFTHTEHGNLIRKAPSATLEIPESFQKTPQACQHCNVNRSRANTFLLQNTESGELKQVGRTCLVDFLGHANPETFAGWAEALWSAMEAAGECDPDGEGSGPRGSKYMSVRLLLGTILRSVKSQGFRSTKVERGSTRDHVLSLQFNRHHTVVAEHAALIAAYPAEIIDPEVDAIFAWAAALPESGLSDYIWNLRVVLLNGYVLMESLGLLCSVTVAMENQAAYALRQAGYVAEKAARQAEAMKSDYVGKIKERITFTGRILFTKFIENDYGGKYLVSLADDQGNRLVSFYSGRDERLFSASGDKRFELKGTVDKHGEYNGAKQTTLKRLSLEREIEEVPAQPALLLEAGNDNEGMVY